MGQSCEIMQLRSVQFTFNTLNTLSSSHPVTASSTTTHFEILLAIVFTTRLIDFVTKAECFRDTPSTRCSTAHLLFSALSCP